MVCPLKVCFFASGRGSNLLKVLEKISAGQCTAEPQFVLSNNSQSFALEIGTLHGLKTYHVSALTEGSSAALASKMIHLLELHEIDLLVLAGYMKPVPLPVLEKMKNKVVNIHPALLPAFGGQGWYGHHIHEGVIHRKCQVTGITIHLVNEIYDEGEIILQRAVKVNPSDSSDILAKKVLNLEHDSLWRVIDAFGKGVLQGNSNGLIGKEQFLNELSLTLGSEFHSL